VRLDHLLSKEHTTSHVSASVCLCGVCVFEGETSDTALGFVA